MDPEFLTMLTGVCVCVCTHAPVHTSVPRVGMSMYTHVYFMCIHVLQCTLSIDMHTCAPTHMCSMHPHTYLHMCTHIRMYVHALCTRTH